MNIELIMKAVNDLKGDLNNCYNNMNIGGFLFIDKDDGEYVISDSKEGNDTCLGYVCEVGKINELITELSNWQPTLPKVEVVEVDGMVYEIGKLYLFSDSNGDFDIGELSAAGDINDGNGFMYQSKVKLRKSSKYEWWSKISKIEANIGTITPAPVKLVDGEAYEFFIAENKMLGRYCLSTNEICITASLFFKVSDCANITHLTAAK